MFHSELGSLVKEEQYKDFVQEAAHYPPSRRRGVTVFLVLGVCLGLVLVAWSCNMLMGLVPGLKLPL